MERKRMMKSGKTKSARKPLADVSNIRKPSKSCSKNSLHRDAALDRLFHCHSRLSTVIHQVDELVAQGLRHKHTCRVENEEIEALATVLSDVHSLLKLWVTRFQQAFATSIEDVGQLECTIIPAATEETKIDTSPKKLDLDSLVISPSPLVSWRASCKGDNGKQLFLLTPLLKPKVPSTKDTCFSTEANSVGPSETMVMPPYSVKPMIMRDTNALERTKTQATLKFSKCSAPKLKSTLNLRFYSSPQPSSKCTEQSSYLVTPLRKISPFKTCMLLEPVSESIQKDTDQLSTMEETSNFLTSKNPELFEFLQGTITRKKLDESFDWFLSPPKTCTVMEPPEKSSSLNEPTMGDFTSELEQATAMVAVNGDNNPSISEEDVDASFPCLESTPTWNNMCTPVWKKVEGPSKSCKLPGESTLKRELWAKFEAVSSSGLQYNLFHDTRRHGIFNCHEEQ